MDYTVEIRNSENETVDRVRVINAKGTSDARNKARKFLDSNPYLRNLSTGRVAPSTHR